MIDELNLGFDEHDDYGRRRRRHGVEVENRGQKRKKKKKKRGRGRSFLALFLAVLLLGGLGGGAYLGYDKLKNFFVTPDYVTASDGTEVQVEIKKGALILDMAKALKAADIIKSEKAFVDASEANPDARKIQPGFYRMQTRLSGADAILMLLDMKNRIVNGVTIPEGWITLQIFAELSKKLNIPLKNFTEAAKNPVALGVPAWWFNRKDGKKSARSLEGFLFPATYEFPPQVTAEKALEMMVRKFLEVTQKMGFVDTVQQERGISPYEALIAASIAQAESAKKVDMGPVVRVIYNRVYSGKYDRCKCLEIDSAVNYWLRIQGKNPKDSNDLMESELNNPKNPYRTHQANGLPLGPISNPGEDALVGAMSPPDSDNIFFVTIDKKGTMGYAKDDSGFRQVLKTACSNGVLYGDLC